MVHIGGKTCDLKVVGRTALLGGALIAVALAQSGASAEPLASNGAGDDMRIVVVHSDDQLGTGGLSQTRSCLHQSVALSEQKPIDGVQSVLLIMKYDSNGKILGVHYGANGICEFLQAAPSKLP